MKVSFILLSLLFVGCAGVKESTKNEIVKSPKISFILNEGLMHPESVLYSHKHKMIFVSNVASGNPLEVKRVSYISKISPDGKIVKSKWVEGLRAPKGMAIVGDDLYVSDVNDIVKIDIKNGKIIYRINVKGSKFLNDVAVDKNGNVYVSDMLANKIHIVKKNKESVWLENGPLMGPNGLYVGSADHLLVANWGWTIDAKTFATKTMGQIIALSLDEKPKLLSTSEEPTGNLDGIDFDNNGYLWVSDWVNGNVFKVTKSGKSEKVYNFGTGTADISFAKELKLLLIPQMNENKIIAVELD